MGQAPIRAAGHALRHAVGVLLLSWARALRAGFIAGVIGVLLVELGAAVMTNRFPPDGNAQLVAALLGFALGFAAALTVVVDEILAGLRDLIDMLSGEAEAGARVAAAVVEREVGESSATLLRRMGLGRLLGEQRPQPTGARRGASSAELSVSLGRAAFMRERTTPTAETMSELAADGDELSQLRAHVFPVRADQLPRLGWTDELPVVRVAADLPAEDSLAELSTAEEAVLVAHEGAVSAAPETIEPATGEPKVQVAADAFDGLAEPPQWHTPDAPSTDFSWHDPAQSAEPQDDEESYIQPIDVFGAPPPLASSPRAESVALPTSPAPSAESTPGLGPRGSVWDHISQVLAGRPILPTPDEPADDATAADAAPDREP
jgi:hypothetical protein